MSHSFGPHTASRALALACAAIFGCAVLSSARPARADQPAAASETSAGSAQAAPPAEAAVPSEQIPVSPSSPAVPPAVPPALPTLVSADVPPPLIWKWARFSVADYVVTGVGGATTLAMAIVHPRAQHSMGAVQFDLSVSDVLRADTLANRYIFRDASDVGVSLMVSWPFVADALTTAWWYRGSREAAQEMALIDLEAFAVTGAVQGVTNVLMSRERPYGGDCGSSELPNESIDCTGAVRYRSFFSGHTSLSFTGAALICVHHFKNELLGAPWDALSCAGGYALATTTGTFRMISDMHYATDVLTGALLGTLVGYGVPLLHYSRRGSSESPMAGLKMQLIPSPGGIGLLGVF